MVDEYFNNFTDNKAQNTTILLLEKWVFLSGSHLIKLTETAKVKIY
jgi:hypothetical protein